MARPPKSPEDLAPLDPPRNAVTYAPGEATALLSPLLQPQRLNRICNVLSRRTRRMTAILDHVFDPHNISACLRSCEAMGIQEIHVVPQPDVELRLSKDVAQGSHRWLEIKLHDSIEDAIAHVRQNGFTIMATDLRGSSPPTPLDEISFTGPLCVIFGSENSGISSFAREEADLRIQLPIWGFVESLNISVAFALIMYDLRQKQIQVTGKIGDLSPEEYTTLLDQWIFADTPNADRVLPELIRRTK
jgi:tRNA (guanosine-2'-O-)-methyltransferase